MQTGRAKVRRVPTDVWAILGDVGQVPVVLVGVEWVVGCVGGWEGEYRVAVTVPLASDGGVLAALGLRVAELLGGDLWRVGCRRRGGAVEWIAL